LGELTALAEAYRTWRAQGQRVALAQVTGAAGSVYRRTGAKMLLAENGDMHGTVSGGCLEPELAEIARSVLAAGVPTTRRYDLAEETMWSLGIGCAGTVEVRVSPLGDALVETWEAVERDLGRFCVVEPVEGEGRLIVGADDGSPVRVDGEPSWSATVREEAIRVARARLLAERAAGRAVLSDGTEVFCDGLSPAPLLVVFGAGHDAVPVCRLAVQAGFRLRVVDPRPGYARPSRLSGAEIRSNDVASAYVGREAFDVDEVIPPGAYAVVLHHHLARDRAALAFLSRSKARYAGILGPRARTLRMIGEIRADGKLGTAFGPDGESGILASPVGLDIGAEGPEEIALAIVAELVAVRAGRNGGRLAGRLGPIHAQGDAAE